MAVAAGTHSGTLELDRGHDDVLLAGRCRELVVIDASVGDESTAGMFVDARSGEVEVSGVTVSGSHHVGVLVGSGTLTIRDFVMVESEYAGVGAAHRGEQGADVVSGPCPRPAGSAPARCAARHLVANVLAHASPG